MVNKFFCELGLYVFESRLNKLSQRYQILEKEKENPKFALKRVYFRKVKFNPIRVKLNSFDGKDIFPAFHDLYHLINESRHLFIRLKAIKWLIKTLSDVPYCTDVLYEDPDDYPISSQLPHFAKILTDDLHHRLQYHRTISSEGEAHHPHIANVPLLYQAVKWHYLSSYILRDLESSKYHEELYRRFWKELESSLSPDVLGGIQHFNLLRAKIIPPTEWRLSWKKLISPSSPEICQLEACVTGNHPSGQAAFRLGKIYLITVDKEGSNFEKACAYFERGAELRNPKSTVAYALFLLFCRENKCLEKAKSLLLNIPFNSFRGIPYLLSYIYEQQQNWDLALFYLGKAVRRSSYFMFPSLEKCYHQWGPSLFIRKFLAHYHLVNKILEDFPSPYLNLVDHVLEMELTEKRKTLVQQALKSYGYMLLDELKETKEIIDLTLHEVIILRPLLTHFEAQTQAYFEKLESFIFENQPLNHQLSLLRMGIIYNQVFLHVQFDLRLNSFIIPDYLLSDPFYLSLKRFLEQEHSTNLQAQKLKGYVCTRYQEGRCLSHYEIKSLFREQGESF